MNLIVFFYLLLSSISAARLTSTDSEVARNEVEVFMVNLCLTNEFEPMIDQYVARNRPFGQHDTVFSRLRQGISISGPTVTIPDSPIKPNEVKTNAYRIPVVTPKQHSVYMKSSHFVQPFYHVSYVIMPAPVVVSPVLPIAPVMSSPIQYYTSTSVAPYPAYSPVSIAAPVSKSVYNGQLPLSNDSSFHVYFGNLSQIGNFISLISEIKFFPNLIAEKNLPGIQSHYVLIPSATGTPESIMKTIIGSSAAQVTFQTFEFMERINFLNLIASDNIVYSEIKAIFLQFGIDTVTFIITFNGNFGDIAFEPTELHIKSFLDQFFVTTYEVSFY